MGSKWYSPLWRRCEETGQWIDGQSLKDEFISWMRNRIPSPGKNFPVRGKNVDPTFSIHYLSAYCMPDTSVATRDKMGGNLGSTGLCYSTVDNNMQEK